MGKTCSKKVFWISPIFSLKWAVSWFRPFLRPGQKSNVPPVFSNKFIKESFAPIGKVKHIKKLGHHFFVFLRYPIFHFFNLMCTVPIRKTRFLLTLENLIQLSGFSKLKNDRYIIGKAWMSALICSIKDFKNVKVTKF